MRPQQWVWLPLALGSLGVLAGLAVVGALFWAAGEQVSSSTQLPFVLVAGGAGVGLVVFGSGLVNSQRRQIERRNLEDAAARMVLAAARLADARRASRSVS